MKQTAALFVRSCLSVNDLPQGGFPEVAVAGRSNVGKSSLINSLLGRKGLARTGSRPGTTRAINFYRLNEAFYLVDLPGFGYAEAGKRANLEWGRQIRRYTRDRGSIVLVLHLVDSRMDPTELDLQLAHWLDRIGVPRTVVATKSDKLSGNSQAMQKRRISECLGGADVILSSATTGQGCKEIWKRMAAAIQIG